MACKRERTRERERERGKKVSGGMCFPFLFICKSLLPLFAEVRTRYGWKVRLPPRGTAHIEDGRRMYTLCCPAHLFPQTTPSFSPTLTPTHFNSELRRVPYGWKVGLPRRTAHIKDGRRKYVFSDSSVFANRSFPPPLPPIPPFQPFTVCRR